MHRDNLPSVAANNTSSTSRTLLIHNPDSDTRHHRLRSVGDISRPVVSFLEYIDMIEYRNIQTRMLGADSFPYRNISITEHVGVSLVVVTCIIYVIR